MNRLRQWISADPWRFAAVILTLGLVATLTVMIAGSPEPTEPLEDLAQPARTTVASTTTVTTSEPTPTTTTTMALAIPIPDVEGETLGGIGGVLAVKIDNAPPARPQVGLGQATLLIEMPVEGGITRFTAVFPPGATGIIGPLRSVRPVDSNLLPAVSPNAISTGGRPFVIDRLNVTDVQHLIPVLYEGFLSGGREDPHNAFIDLGSLLSLIGSSDTEGFGLPAGELPDPSGTATSVGIPFDDIELRYDNGRYVRYGDGEPFMVLESLDDEPQQLSHDTVVVMFVAERDAGYQDSNGASVPTFDVIGSGELVVFHGGYMFEGYWSRPAHADPYSFVDGSGNVFGLPEQTTYLAFVPRQLAVDHGS